jgi:hypothetical protein
VFAQAAVITGKRPSVLRVASYHHTKTGITIQKVSRRAMPTTSSSRSRLMADKEKIGYALLANTDHRHGLALWRSRVVWIRPPDAHSWRTPLLAFLLAVPGRDPLRHSKHEEGNDAKNDKPSYGLAHGIANVTH